MASIELKEKNGVMTEVVRIADFMVWANDTVTTSVITPFFSFNSMEAIFQILF